MSEGSTEKRVSTASLRLLLVLLLVIWANSFTAIKHLREVFSPRELVLARFLPVALFASVSLAWTRARRRECAEILREEPLRLAAMGLTGVAGYNYFLYLGQSEVKPGAAALLTTLSPLFTLFLAILFLREKVPVRRAVGIIVSLIGLFVVVRYGKVGLGRVTGPAHSDVRYVLITSLAPLSWSLYTILGKPILRRFSPIVVTYLTLIIGTLPFLGIAGGPFFPTLFALTATQWIALAYLSVFCTLIGFWIWFAALKRMPATSVASFVYLNPPLAALFGSLFFGEEIGGLFILGGAVLLFGLYLAQNGAEGRSERSDS